MLTNKALCVILSLCLLYFIMCRQLEYYLSSTDPVLDQLQRDLAVLHPKFARTQLYVGDKSYTINKKKVYICLKDQHDRYYNRNMLVYVILHEYAHILCDEIGHTPKFFDIFDKVLAKATEKGLYNPSIPLVKEYCGHE